MNFPSELKYSKSHEWVKAEADGSFLIGITDYAQDQLSSLVFINLPEDGAEITEGEAFCDVESVKAVSDVIAPISGKILEVNEALADAPEMLNDDPYGAWICRVESDGQGELLSAEEYDAFCEEEGNA